MHHYLVIGFLLLCVQSFGQSSAHQIVEKSIEYHDPQKKLLTKKVTFHFAESRPDGMIRKSKAITWPKKEYFLVNRSSNEVSTTMISNRGKATFLINGSSDIDTDQAEKYRLNEDRLKMMTSYYRYLWHLPLTLLDEGTIIHKSVNDVDFFGKQCLEVKVTYDSKIGDDTWYFYFNPNTFALEGYRFYHDESKNDGEYILLSDIQDMDGVRIPKIRKWYTHQGDRFLGTDTLVSFEVD